MSEWFFHVFFRDAGRRPPCCRGPWYDSCKWIGFWGHFCPGFHRLWLSDFLRKSFTPSCLTDGRLRSPDICEARCRMTSYPWNPGHPTHGRQGFWTNTLGQRYRTILVGRLPRCQRKVGRAGCTSHLNLVPQAVPLQFLLSDGDAVDRPCCGCAWINWWNVSKSQRNLRCGDGRWSWRNRRWIRVTFFWYFIVTKLKRRCRRLRPASIWKWSKGLFLVRFFFGTATYSYYSCCTMPIAVFGMEILRKSMSSRKWGWKMTLVWRKQLFGRNPFLPPWLLQEVLYTLGGNPMIAVKHEKKESVGPLTNLHYPVTHSLCMVGFWLVIQWYLLLPRKLTFPENQHILLKWSLFGGWT